MLEKRPEPGSLPLILNIVFLILLIGERKALAVEDTLFLIYNLLSPGAEEHVLPNAWR